MSNLIRKTQQLRALLPWERHLIAKLVFLLPMAWLVLTMFGFNRTRRISEFDLQLEFGPIDQAVMERAQRYAQLTAIAARHGVYKANCLHQSLVLCWLLRRKNWPAQIRIGVLPNTQPFQAHAWVELNGHSLGQSIDQYKAFDRLTPDSDKAKFI